MNMKHDTFAPASKHVAGPDSVAADQLRSIVERVEGLEAERATTADHIKEVYAEAKSNGFDTKAIRKVVAARKKDPQERTEDQLTFDTYLRALGMTS